MSLPEVLHAPAGAPRTLAALTAIVMRSRVLAAGASLLISGVSTASVSAQAPRVTPGITVLVRDSLHLIQGKRVGLITNHTGRDASGVSSVDLLAKATGVKLVALFGPEHGLRGAAQAGETVASSVDSATGVPIFSLYGATRVPTDSMLANIDVLVYDIQDVGARTYTFAWTMALSADAAGRRGIPFIVCDRPVPIRGDRVGGGVLDTAFRSFVGQYPVPLRYGLTPGELLRYLVRTKQVTASVMVVPMHGWTRRMWYEDTGLPWIAPSPNLRTVDASLLYPGTVLVEGSNMSEGRGTDAPFQLIGAPWLDDLSAIIRTLSAMPATRGVAFDSVSRTIEAGQKLAGQTIPMLRIRVTDRDAVEPVRLGIAVLAVIRQRHAKEFTWREAFFDKLSGSSRLRRAINTGTAAAMAVVPIWEREARRFAESTRQDLIYR